MEIEANLSNIKDEINNFNCTLVAISKTKPVEAILQVYKAGIQDFGENKVQELVEKQEQLPDDIRWHMVGHLQRNKVKYIAPFIYMIHSVDGLKLLKEINKQGQKNDRIIPCLLQVHIAEETTKFGLDREEVFRLLRDPEIASLRFVAIRGLMGMATNTSDENQVRREFQGLRALFEEIKQSARLPENVNMKYLSMGMSSDYKIALQEGSNMVRLGSTLFGKRNYHL